MKNLNKFILTITLCILCLLSIFCSTVFASDTLPFISQDSYLNWIELPVKEDVPIDKAWSILFTQPINKSSLNSSSIYIVDEKYNTVDTSLQISEDGKTIKIIPTYNYSPGHPYYLYVTNRVISTTGYSFSTPTCMTFTINTNSTKVDDTYNNQNIELKKNDILELTLPENYDGGYSWQFKPSLNSNILKITDDIYIMPYSSPNIVGGVGKQRWLIQAIGTGTTSINLKELRPWDANSTLSTFKLNITVK